MVWVRPGYSPTFVGVSFLYSFGKKIISAESKMSLQHMVALDGQKVVLRIKQGSISDKVLTEVSQQCINDCLTSKPQHVQGRRKHI